jgi:hypothetical protein
MATDLFKLLFTKNTGSEDIEMSISSDSRDSLYTVAMGLQKLPFVSRIIPVINGIPYSDLNSLRMEIREALFARKSGAD